MAKGGDLIGKLIVESRSHKETDPRLAELLVSAANALSEHERAQAAAIEALSKALESVGGFLSIEALSKALESVGDTARRRSRIGQ